MMPNKDGKLTEAELPTAHAKRIVAVLRSQWRQDASIARVGLLQGRDGIRERDPGDQAGRRGRHDRHRRPLAVSARYSAVAVAAPLWALAVHGERCRRSRHDPQSGHGGADPAGAAEGSSDRYYASPVAGDGKIYISSENGKVLVLPQDGGLDALAVNDLQDNIYATPALSDKRIYVRTLHSLYLFRIAAVARTRELANRELANGELRLDR